MKLNSPIFPTISFAAVMFGVAFQSVNASWLSKTIEHNKHILDTPIKPVSDPFKRNEEAITTLINEVATGKTSRRSKASASSPAAVTAKKSKAKGAENEPVIQAAPPPLTEAEKNAAEITKQSDATMLAYYRGALEVVSGFENDDENKYTGVTLDFDTQGISLGICQWNIRQGSLQPLVKKAGKATVLKYMPHYGIQFWTVCTTPVEKGLELVQSWQDITPEDKANGVSRKARWKPQFKGMLAELKSFLGSQEMQAIQLSAVAKNAESAWRYTWAWVQSSRIENRIPTLREFTVFFDTVVQNGDMAGFTYSDVKRWYDNHKSRKPSTVACQWLAKSHAPDFQTEDARKNAVLWSKTFPVPYEPLLLLSLKRAEESYGSESNAQALVLCRRDTILANDGWINGKRRSFPQLASDPLLARR
jgi:hypothetical protein